MYKKIAFVLGVVLLPSAVFAGDGSGKSIDFAGIPVEFILFGLTLLGIALMHKHVLKVALSGLPSFCSKLDFCSSILAIICRKNGRCY